MADTYKPTEAMASAARRGLKMRESQPPSNRGGTAVGLARARQLVNRENLSLDTVKRMYSFFSRHEVDKQSDSWKEGNSKGEQAWLLWGGDAGFSWSRRIVKSLETNSEQGSDMSKLGVLVVNAVSGDMIREENFQGEPHYMIASATMPDDIVMNGLLYPAEEIEASYMGLNGVHAPLGHPEDENGDFISASTPYAIRHYGVGAQVVNVRRENGRVLHDTAINIAVAKSTDRGKRLLDRIEAMKNGDNTKPIHTSTGIYLKKRELPEPQTNQYGEYHAIATNYVFDHNAILLDEIGAATPNEGTGMFVNANGEQVPVFVMNEEAEFDNVVSISGDDKYDELRALEQAIREDIISKHISGENEWCWIRELHAGYVIAEIQKGQIEKSYKIAYMIDGEKVTTGELQEVKRNVVYTAVNSLKKFIKSMGFAPSNHTAYNSDVNNTTDEESEMTKEEMQALLAEQSEKMQANFDEKLASVVKPLEDKIASLETNAQAAEQAEKTALAEKLGLEADEVAGMSVNTLQKMAAKLDAQDQGEYGQRLGALDVNSAQGKEEFSTDLSKWGTE